MASSSRMSNLASFSGRWVKLLPARASKKQAQLTGLPTAQGAATGALGAALAEHMDAEMVASLGGFSNMINDMKIPKAMALFSVMPEHDAISLTVSLYGVKLFGLAMEIFVHAIGNSGTWDCFVYIGFLDINGGFLDFPMPWAPISLVINMGVVIENEDNPENDIDALLSIIDPHNNKQMTYSQVVQLLSN